MLLNFSYRNFDAFMLNQTVITASGLKLGHNWAYVPHKILNTFVTLWHVAA